MPYISAVLREGQGRGGRKKEKEVQVFYIAYVIRLAHESSGCDENRPAPRKDDGVAGLVAYPSRIARASVSSSSTFSRDEIESRRSFTVTWRTD